MRRYLVAFIVGFGLFLAQSGQAATYTVNTIVDGAVDADGCEHPYLDADNDCTLREAITAANTIAGVDLITFNISSLNFADDGDGQFTIALSSALPDIVDEVAMDAGTLWDSDDVRPGVAIKGGSLVGSENGLTIIADRVQVKGLVVADFPGSGIRLAGNSSIIGTDCNGAADAAERNIIVTNALNGIGISGNSNVIAANDIIGNGSGDSDDAGIVLNDTADSNIIGLYSDGCAAAEQLNVISGNNGNGIYMHTADNNLITGNYIGVDRIGTTALGNTYHGIFLDFDNQSNIIGTNGNGVNDSDEGNIIANNTLNGMVLSTDALGDVSDTPTNNRISGNRIAANVVNGIIDQGNSTIIGWCDSTINATLCSDAGAAVDQANYIIDNVVDGIQFGPYADNASIFSNVIGERPDGTEAGNGGDGIDIHKRNAGHVIGASGDQANIITNNAVGIHVESDLSDDEEPIEDITITGNTIKANTTDGVRCAETMEYRSGSYTYEVTLDSNTISTNGDNGVELVGCQWEVTDNTFEQNTGWGISVAATERPDDPSNTADVYDNPYDALSPQNADTDLVPVPNIDGNTLSDNTAGGIYLLDTTAANADTLASDNTFSSTVTSTYRVRRDWYGAIQLLNDDRSDDYTTGNFTVTLTPANGSCLSTCTGSTVATAGNTAIWGPTGIEYDDASTWFLLTELTVGANGNSRQYSPYTITASSNSLTTDTNITHSFDGVDNDNDRTIGSLTQGITTDGLYRYQIAGVTLAANADSTDDTDDVTDDEDEDDEEETTTETGGEDESSDTTTEESDADNSETESTNVVTDDSNDEVSEENGETNAETTDDNNTDEDLTTTTDTTDDTAETAVLEQVLVNTLETTTIVGQTTTEDGVTTLTTSDNPLLNLLLPPAEDVTLSGKTLPNAVVAITICYSKLSTDSDDDGNWILTISRDMLSEGENVITAHAEKDGVVTEDVEVARIVVQEPPRRTLLFGSFFAALALAILNIMAYALVRNRGVVNRRAWPVMLTSDLMAVLLFVVVVVPNYWKVYDLAATPAEAVAPSTSVAAVNQQDITTIQTVTAEDISSLDLAGMGQAEQTIALTVCDGQPFRTTTVKSDEQWDVGIPVTALPKAKFLLSSQSVQADGELGDPDRLLSVTVSKRDLFKVAQNIFMIGFVLLAGATLVTWWWLLRQVSQPPTQLPDPGNVPE
ncbi:MAG: hypothetical protein HY565_04875 [Candidatus Kerfeldbacteria bacterium]|nr:hypothetical protein [Candidatus Kerfeldbacteria bacterium]